MSDTATMEREPNRRCVDCGHAASEHDEEAKQCFGGHHSTSSSRAMFTSCGCRAIVWAVREEE